jgi:hypothetical protein
LNHRPLPRVTARFAAFVCARVGTGGEGGKVGFSPHPSKHKL